MSLFKRLNKQSSNGRNRSDPGHQSDAGRAEPERERAQPQPEPEPEPQSVTPPEPASEVDAPEEVEVEPSEESEPTADIGSPEAAETPEQDSADSERFIDPKLIEIRRRDAETVEPEQRLTADEVLTPVRPADAADLAADAPGADAQPGEGGVRVIAFANQKGGVAKTTTTLNLGVAFAETGHRVLCVDMDPQGNLTMSQGIDPDKVDKSMFDVLVHGTPITEAIQSREVDVACSSIDLAGAEIAMSAQIGRERALEKALVAVRDDYDFVLIDTPPSLGLLTVNALTAAHKVIVPVQCEYLSMRGLVQLQNTLSMIRENLNPDVTIEGILPTMMDTRTVHAKEAIEILEENFGKRVFTTRIRKTIKFAEAPVRGSSVLKYDPEGKAAGYYRELAKEVMDHGA